MSEITFFQMLRGESSMYFIYQRPAYLKLSNPYGFADEKTVVMPREYVCVAKGEFNDSGQPTSVLENLFFIYNHQDPTEEDGVLRHYGGSSMSSGDVIELRWLDGHVESWLCGSFGWHLIKKENFMV